MTDADIKVGDVCVDLVKRGKVQIVGKVADTVEEHQQTESYDIADYKAHPLLDVADDEPVFKAVYLPDEPTVSFSGTYDFPRSRLARLTVEEAKEDIDRPQNGMAVQILFQLFQTAAGGSMASSQEALLDVASHSALPEDVVETAAELAQVDQQFEGGDGDE
jgi:hypothetical protein